MALRFSLLSPNLVQIIGECLQNQDLAKLLYYGGQDPLTQLDFDTSIIAPFSEDERLFPYPFDIGYKEEERSQLHIYYPDLQLKNNSHVEHTVVWFDIIVHKKLWLFKQGTDKLVRPYEIASKLANHFDGRSIGTVGQLNFMGMAHVTVNEEFNGLRLEAVMTTY